MFPELKQGQTAADEKYADRLATPDPLYAVLGIKT
jgi:hypothetical protein